MIEKKRVRDILGGGYEETVEISNLNNVHIKHRQFDSDKEDLPLRATLEIYGTDENGNKMCIKIKGAYSAELSYETVNHLHFGDVL